MHYKLCTSKFSKCLGSNVCFMLNLKTASYWTFTVSTQHHSYNGKPRIIFPIFTVITGVRVLVDAREKLHIPWGDPSNQAHGDTMMAFDTRSAMGSQGMVETKVFLQYLPSIRALWADSGIQNAYDRRREFQLVSFWWSLKTTWSHNAFHFCNVMFLWVKLYI